MICLNQYLKIIGLPIWAVWNVLPHNRKRTSQLLGKEVYLMLLSKTLWDIDINIEIQNPNNTKLKIQKLTKMDIGKGKDAKNCYVIDGEIGKCKMQSGK